MDLKKRLKKEGGFTLIELIAVIIILGVLAAVITPKYFDMTSKATEAAYKGAMAEGSARFNMAYSQYILVTNQKPAALSNLEDSAYLGADTDKVNIGDYNIKYTATSSTLTMELSKNNDSTNAVVMTQTAPWPQ